MTLKDKIKEYIEDLKRRYSNITLHQLSLFDDSYEGGVADGYDRVIDELTEILEGDRQYGYWSIHLN